MKEKTMNKKIIKDDLQKNVKHTEKKVKKQSKGIDAFVTSIISILTIAFWYICLPTGIYALVRSIICVKKSGYGLSKAAFIISLIALTIFVALYTQILVTYMLLM